jgi:hypothetical protein
MSTSNAIENLVERFVEDLVGFLQQEEGERRAAALAIVMSMLGQSSLQASAPARPVRKPTRNAAIWSRQRRQPSAVEPVREATTENVAKPEPEPEPTLRPRVRHPRMIVVPAGQSAATYKPPSPSFSSPSFSSPSFQSDSGAIESSAEPASQRRLVQGAAEREALMLESVRTLVRATAGEIAQHGGLPSGTAYVALKQLIANGRVAKIETSRGMEYSLVSTGAVRPFKRSRGAEAEAAGEQAPAATGEV